MKRFIPAIAFVAIGLAACSPSVKAQKQIACKIMTDPGTHLTYTACPARKHSEANPTNDNVIIWWLLLNQQNQPATVAAGSKGTTWARTAPGFAPPTTLVPTGTVAKIDPKTNEPEEEAVESVEEAEAQGDIVTDEDSNAGEAVGDAGGTSGDAGSSDGGGSLGGGDSGGGGGDAGGGGGDAGGG